MKWLLAILIFLCGCFHKGNLVGYDNVEPDNLPADVIRVPVVAHIRTLRDMWTVVPNQIKNANKQLAPHGLVIDRIIYVADSNQMLVKMEDRSKFLRHPRQMGKAIHLVMVLGIYSSDKNPSFLAGLYSQSTQNSCHGYVALSDIAKPQTFIHELGHLLGLDHVNDPNNIMSVNNRKKKASFTPEQIEIMMGNARVHARKCW